MEKDKEFQAVVLGALLHDIGKFIQRAQQNPKKQDHSRWGIEWFQQKDGLRESPRLAILLSNDELQIIDSAILNHHNSEPYISLADSLSAGMDRILLDDEEEGDPFTDRLLSIFSRLSITEKKKEDYYHRLVPLTKDNIEKEEVFPISERKCSYKEYATLLNAFNQEIKMANFSGLSIEQVINYLYFLLWKYTWSIPSAAYREEPDVSLFDHLKTTGAIAGCLYSYQQEHSKETLDVETKAFCLIEGDISGIQNYIFSILSQQGKVAKRLRARSLFVQLISEIATHRILHTFNLPMCNSIMSAGGNFYILAPNIKGTKERIEELKKEFDKWMINQLSAELSINLASIELSGKDLMNFSEVLDKLKTALNHNKYQPHKSILLSEGKWFEEEFLRPEVIEGDEKVCQGCRKHPGKGIDNLCERCFMDTKIGQSLPKKEYLVFFDNENRHEFKVLNYSFELWDKEDLEKRLIEKPYLILVLNNSEIRLPTVGFKYLTTHIPTGVDISQAKTEEKDQPVSFEDIANTSIGDKLLGYLKGDVDNLGDILRYGFNPEEPGNKYKIKGIKPSISRFAALSRMLETFFTAYLQTKLETDFKEIYSVFSGGDDFFLIGPWNKAIDLAKVIREKFSLFSGNNPDLTFSSGIVLFKSHEPISFCTELVQKALETAKERKDKESGKQVKDGITIFGQTIGWSELDKVLTEAKKVIEWLEKEPPIISRAFIYNLKKYGEMADISGIYKPGAEIKTEYLKFIPLLTYDINRNLTKKEQENAYLWAEALKPSQDKPLGGDNLPYLKIIMEYVLSYTRGG